MFGLEEDLLDDLHWKNVQDPIKHMFMSISKAIKSQAAGIRELDQKFNGYLTKDAGLALVKEGNDQCCSKQDATQLIFQIDSKASEKEVAVIVAKLDQVISKVDKFENCIQDHATAIASMSNRLDTFELELHKLRNPDYGPIFGYIDRQVSNVNADMDRKLCEKADHKEVETVIPQRLEDIYRAIHMKLNEVKVEIAKSATKEEVQILANVKANATDLRELSTDLYDRVSKAELTQSVNSQVKPLITAISSLEKAIQIHEVTNKAQNSTFTDKIQFLEKLYHEQHSNNIIMAQLEKQQETVMAEKTRKLIEEIVMNEMQLHRSTPEAIQSLLTTQLEYVLKQLNIVTDSMRLELVSANQEEFNHIHRQIQQRISDVADLATEISTKHAKTRKHLKELSLNVANALSRKLDIKDFKRIHSDPAAASAGGGRYASGSSSMRDATTAELLQSIRNHKPTKADRIVHGSRDLLNTSHEEHLTQSSDPTREFDYLVQSMREGRKLHSKREKHVSSVPASSQSEGGFSSEYEEKHDFHDEVEPEIEASPHHSPLRATTGSIAHGRGGGMGRSLSAGAINNSRHGGGVSKSILKNTAPLPHHGKYVSLRDTISAMEGDMNLLRTTIRSNQKEIAELRESLHSARQGMSSSPTRSRFGTASGTAGVGGSVLDLNMTQTIRDQTIAHAATVADMERLDWRLAVGEVSMNLRRELADKVSREELYSVVRGNRDMLEQKCSSTVDQLAPIADLTKLANELNALRNRVSGELTGARFLWTNGHLLKDGWIPWDTQVVNAAPSVFVWKKAAASIEVKLPGLYRLSLAVFTCLPVIIQIYLNDEPIFSYQPESLDNQAVLHQHQMTSNTMQKSDRYYLRRLRHSAGEVTSICIDEKISLPAEAKLMIRYHSTSTAQAFLAIKKL